MPNIGLPELVVILLAPVFAAIPIATLVFAFLTYRKAVRIEERLTREP